ncbi:MAG: hypothetical protein U0031_15020 [Thermomicrobiales bacterium]
MSRLDRSWERAQADLAGVRAHRHYHLRSQGEDLATLDPTLKDHLKQPASTSSRRRVHYRTRCLARFDRPSGDDGSGLTLGARPHQDVALAIFVVLSP